MASFHLVRLDCNGETIILDNHGNPWVIEGAEEAQRLARDYTHYYRVKHQPRPIKIDTDWRAREIERFESGHYTKLPWHNEEWVGKVKECADHFAHVSKNDPTRLAFVVNEAKAQADVKTQMRPSKYLANYYSKVLNEDAIRALVAGYKKLYDPTNNLSFAYSGREILRVYRHGPQSCMSYSLDHYRTKVHPVTVYEGPDLAVAYIPRDKRIVARSLVWPEKKLHSRIYGDEYLMAELLSEEGYKRGSLQGARISKVKEGNRYVCPFIDGTKRVDVGNQYLIIDQAGSRAAANADGFCGQGFMCGCCNVEQDLEEVGHHTVGGGNYCSPCYDQALAAGKIALCARDGRAYRRGQLVEMFDGRLWHQAYIDNRHGFQCDTCNRNYPNEVRYITPRRDYYDPYRCRDCGVPQRELPLEQPKPRIADTSEVMSAISELIRQ